MKRTGETSAPPASDLRCERVRLLLSAAADGASTPAQDEEIDAHLPACAGCRAARAADIAVRERCATPATVPTGFADRVALAVRRQRLEARAQNRFLVAATVAAVMVAGVATFAFRTGTPRPTSDPAAQIARDTAGEALRAGLALDRNPRGLMPGSGVEDR